MIMNNNQRRLLDMLADNAEEISNFESEGLEQLENVIGSMMGRNAQAQFRSRVGMNALKGKVNQPMVSSASMKNIANDSKLSFTLVAERVGITTGVALPALLFGTNDLQSGWANVANLPAGISISKVDIGIVAGISYGQKLEISYTDGVNTDKIRVTCTNNPYPVLLEATKSDLMLMNGVRLSLSDATQVSQFDQILTVFKNQIAGKSDRDNLIPTSYKNPEQFQTGIVDITEMISVDKNTTIQCNIIPIAGFKVSFNFYAGKLVKWNAADMVGGR